MDDATTFQYPLVPENVLIDPVSIPKCLAILGDIPDQSPFPGQDVSCATPMTEVSLNFAKSPADPKSRSAAVRDASHEVNGDAPLLQHEANNTEAAAATGEAVPDIGAMLKESEQSESLDAITGLLHQARQQHRHQSCPVRARSLQPSSSPVQYSGKSPQVRSGQHRKTHSQTAPITLGNPTGASVSRPAGGAAGEKPPSPITGKDLDLVTRYLKHHTKDLKKEFTDLEVAEHKVTELGDDRGRHYKTAPENKPLEPVVRDSFDIGQFGLSWPKFPGSRLRQQLHHESAPAPTSYSTTFSQLTLYDMEEVEMPEDARTSFVNDSRASTVRPSPIKLGLEDFQKELRNRDSQKHERSRRWKVGERKSSQTSYPPSSSQGHVRHRKMSDSARSKDPGWWNG